jgi:hypothetical protein
MKRRMFVQRRRMQMNCRIWCIFVAAVLTGCASRATRVIPAPQAAARLQVPYVDLQPGWRLRVITPLTKSGTYKLAPTREQQNGGTVTLAAGDDFLGYETSLYSVQPRGRNGVRIEFISAEETKDGVTTAEAHPRIQLFGLPRRAKYVRLLYLTRVSRSDHDMAVVAASRQELLAQVTAQVQSDSRACHNDDGTFCSWIPAGIAVRPEKRAAGDNGSWAPAQ